MGISTMMLAKEIVSSAWIQFMPSAMSPEASKYVGMLCAIPIHRAAKLYVVQVRRFTGTGARSSLKSGPAWIAA